MGNDLFDTVKYVQLSADYHSGIIRSPKYSAFVIDHDVHSIGMVSNQYYYLKNLKTGKEDFVSMTSNEPVPVNASTDSTKKYWQKLTDAYYETAKYLMLNNKKKP